MKNNSDLEQQYFRLHGSPTSQAPRSACQAQEEARAEAMTLMGVRDGLVTPKSGEVAVCATQESVSSGGGVFSLGGGGMCVCVCFPFGVHFFHGTRAKFTQTHG